MLTSFELLQMNMQPQQIPGLAILAILAFATACAPLTRDHQVAHTVSTESFHAFESRLNGIAGDAISATRQVDRTRASHAFKETFGLEIPLDKEIIKTLDQEELSILARALYNLAFYAPHKEYTDDLHFLYSQARKGTMDNGEAPIKDDTGATLPSASDVYEELINTRSFDAAGEFYNQYQLAGDIEPIHRLHQFGNLESHAIPDNPALELDDDKRIESAKLREIDLHNGIQVLAMAHPLCGPSRAAMEYFESDDRGTENVSDLITWVASPRSLFRYQQILDWNSSSRNVDLVISYDATEWPSNMSLEVTPVFYVLKDGELTETVVGWPGGDQYEALSTAVSDAGMR